MRRKIQYYKQYKQVDSNSDRIKNVHCAINKLNTIVLNEFRFRVSPSVLTKYFLEQTYYSKSIKDGGPLHYMNFNQNLRINCRFFEVTTTEFLLKKMNLTIPWR